MSTKQAKKTAINLLDREQAYLIAKEVLLKMGENPSMTLKEATGVSDQAIEEVYSLAHMFYNQGKYGESIALFELLAGASPNTYKFILGLGASYHQIQAYEEAAMSFFVALNLEPENPLPAYYAMDCCLKRNLTEEALEFAEVTSLICAKKPEHAAMKKKCELIIKSLRLKK
jgi:type III secretion system low calcium response chaperone LcrH/SycD